MENIKYLWMMLICCLSFEVAIAQTAPCSGHFIVRDSMNREPLFLATVVLMKDHHPVVVGSCHTDGSTVLQKIPKGEYLLQVSFIGYKTYTDTLLVEGDFQKEIHLSADPIQMQEVVVTAQESHGMTSSSIIKRRAMEHLQPSSFSDLLELLPGGRSADPELSRVNTIRLREAGKGSSSSDYYISSLGVAFHINGTPIHTGADMLYLSGASDSDEQKYSTSGRGIDMRSISTDAIEQVEIIRGIPSVEYGHLTSGVVNIKRKTGGEYLHARFKADESSKLIYLGKGFEFPKRKLSWNIDVDWLSAKADPRNHLENYKRLTFSTRMQKIWNIGVDSVDFQLSVDYNGSFNTAEIDPDINHHKEDSYKTRVNRFAYINNITWQRGDPSSFFKSLSFNSSISYSKDKMEESRYVSLSRALAAPIGTTAGEHDGIFLPFQYVGHQKVDNQPFGANARLTGHFGFNTIHTRHRFKAGVDWQMNKNFGKGQIYDPLSPTNPTAIATRPRPYKEIRADHDLALFAETHCTTPIANHTFEVQAGVRVLTQLNLPKHYHLHNQLFIDPRINAKWQFPTLFHDDKRLVFELGGGIGWHTLFPSLAQLYPNLIYDDIIQLNYYHNNPDYRRLQMITYIFDPTNPDLSAARNLKWELRGNVHYAGHDLTVTLFREKMNSGFRTGTEIVTRPYKRYNSTSIDPNSLNGPPQLEKLTYTQDTMMRVYGIHSNGTSLRKEGVEFQFASKRIPALATRITVSGAYFRTTYSNSEGEYRQANEIINNRPIPYVGWYEDPDGYVRRSFNTNFMFDTYLEALKLNFSLSAQCLWFSDQQTERKTGIPTHYVDNQGNRHPYTEESQKDIYLQWLTDSYNEALFDRNVQEPFNINLNLKVTKQLYKERIKLGIYVNRLISFHPDYTSNGVKVRQIGKTPYFGMELNFNI